MVWPAVFRAATCGVITEKSGRGSSAHVAERPPLAPRRICSAVSPTRSAAGMSSAAAIENTVSSEGLRSARSRSEMAVRSRPAAKASCSCVIPRRRRACLSASAKARSSVRARIKHDTL